MLLRDDLHIYLLTDLLQVGFGGFCGSCIVTYRMLIIMTGFSRQSEIVKVRIHQKELWVDWPEEKSS